MKLQSLIAFVFILTLTACNTKAIKTDNGLVKKESQNDFETTYSNLKSTISSNPNLKILLELDHSNNASSVGLNLNKTKIIMFGNPKLGTPLIQDSQTTSIDLPQKIVVYTDANGVVFVAFNDPQYLKSRHDIKSSDAILEKISNALNTITNKAIAVN